MAVIGTDIDAAAELLRNGKLVAIPTETVYGLAGNALIDDAILEIFKVKRRPKFDPLIAHTDSLDKVKSYVKRIPEVALKLADAFWPGPLTILLEKQEHIPDLLTSGLPAVAVRMPNHPLTTALLKQLDFPLAAPSANPFGYVSPTSAQHVEDQLGTKIPYILDGGPCSIGIESTIIGFDEQEKPIIYRLGGKKIEDIEAVVGKVKLKINHSSDPMAPGMLKSHYAPSKRVIIGKLDMLIERFKNQNFGIISFHKKFNEISEEKQIVLSPSKDLSEAARNLFSALRIMDQKNIDLILTEKFPEEGLGAAINDRLKRAASR
ncbi:MAG: threonylcarbamoyl-AMP synthase [Flammeovirgaceae bacterium]|nr:threonylcarbamoyl-AMP synthase [Flammeovirgaceae bacterium]MBE62355.1 threonylcarbamoyl-AMP synthase [Flammeovirgaceae bacterium]HCX23876.1 threonylcarbamoyl-AMP synthase [Cytophagales bacterium]|tara:strand:+ start:119 stop:1078 length:960 start_codon:yes stop_codon:yes gene_type:complete